jgi:hypothetical protein
MHPRPTVHVFLALSFAVVLLSLSCKKAEENGTKGQKVYKPIGSEAEFLENIDDHYEKLNLYWSRGNYFIAISYLDYFIKYKRSDYKDVRRIGTIILKVRLGEPLIYKAEKKLHYERLIKLDPDNKEEYLSKIASEETQKPSPIANEKLALRDSFFGDYRGATVRKTSGTITLEVWRPYTQYISQTFIPKVSGALLQGSQRLDVTYDEIWVWENKQADVSKLYWKNNKIQAATFAEYYIGNPVTNMPLATPSYKIANIYNREYIINKLLHPY